MAFRHHGTRRREGAEKFLLRPCAMGHIRIRYFEDFKSTDTLLLDGDAEGLRLLAQAFGRLADGEIQTIAVHELSFVRAREGLKVFASLGSRDIGARFERPMVLVWRRSPLGRAEAADELAGLAAHTMRHQYLDDGSDVSVMVSRGEYSDRWWESHG
jgi:hypothetical protein